MIGFLKSIVPKSLKVSVRNSIQSYFKRERAAVLKAIPNIDLQQKHIEHLTVLTNRKSLLECLPKGSVAAEIGVNKGEFSTEILSIVSPGKFHLVDAWGTDRYNEGIYQSVLQLFSQEIKNDKVVVSRGFSTDVVHTFSDSYFDWIYIDTDHSYNLTKRELSLYESKMKPGGIIAGHDFVMGNWREGLKYGVMEAVYEFCVARNWELIYLSIESSTSPSFAIRKIAP